EAQQLITEAGLTADVQYRVDNSVEVGRVIGQELAAGEVVAQGSTLTFYVSEDEEAEPEEESEPGEEPEAAPEPEPQDNAATQATTAPPQNDAGAETEIPDASGGSFTPGYGESMLTYINQYRTEAGVAPLAWDTGLAIEAQQIAIEKEKDRETTFHGSGLSMWMFNIGSGTAEESVQAIMRSTAKDVLLDAKLTVIGAARYITASGEYYYTFAYR
ncbi:MAG: PASTA domain-containing protein, partial [Eubacteriales bacterium]|nr:PASTA domain-containing protein [Eubacteriales bacterium]